MKKKILFSMISMLIITILTLAIVASIVGNLENNESVQNYLKNNNKIVMDLFTHYSDKEKQDFFKDVHNNSDIRVTYIDITGKVLGDSVSDAETMDNHNTRPEIIEAREKGEGSSIRNSATTKQRMMYYATLLKDGSIIRSSMAVKGITEFHEKFFHLYMYIILVFLILSILVSSKLTKMLVKPINELEFIISRVADGELYRRIKVTSRDEIGKFAEAFNHMADKLQDTIKDGLHKQTRLEAILRSMESGVIAVDRDYKVIMINPYAEKIFGISKDVIGHNLMDEIRDFELENIFKLGNGDYKEIKLLWPKERELRIKTADIVDDNSFIGTVAVIQDITDIKKLENMRSHFVANVSHELKTPLTSIKGFSETLKYVEDPEKREKFLDIINDESDRLGRLINDILTLSDIENIKEKVLIDIDLNKEIGSVCELLKQTADTKNISLSFTNNGDAVIKGDKDRFTQMMLNLIDNAIKYSEPGGSVWVTTEISENKAVISVQDTGVGISKDDKVRIFERFYRVDKARSRKQGGTGLGLAIVKHIVLGLNGTIEVESEVLKGSKFIVKIPLKG